MFRLLIALSLFAFIAPGYSYAACSLDGGKIAALNAKLMGSTADQLSALAPLQTAVSLFGADCIYPLVGGLMNARHSALPQGTQILKDAGLIQVDGTIKVIEQSFDGVLDFYIRSYDPNNINAAHADAVLWMTNYAFQFFSVSYLSRFVDACKDRLSLPEESVAASVGAEKSIIAACGVAIRKLPDAQQEAVILTIRQQIGQPSKFTVTQLALANAGWRGIYQILDFMALTREAVSWDTATDLIQSHWPVGLDATTQNTIDERFIDAIINQLTAPYCIQDHVIRTFADLLGARGARAISALQQRANLPRGSFGFNDCGQFAAQYALAKV